ncbi:MAG: hypothetical protein WCB09_10660, partial [Methylocella sp.]
AMMESVVPAMMESVVPAMMTPAVSTMMAAASGCFARGEHRHAEHSGGAKDHEFMHWTLPFPACGRRERIAATLTKHLFLGEAIPLMADDNEPPLSRSGQRGVFRAEN